MQTCCCSISVRDGTIAIASITLVGAIIGFVSNLQNSIDIGIVLGHLGSGYWELDVPFALVLILTIYCLASGVLSAGLLYGVSRNIVKRCAPWYYYHLTAWYIALILSLIFILLFVFAGNGSIWVAIIASPIVIAILVVQRYFIGVVDKYVVELRESGTGAPMELSGAQQGYGAVH